MKNANEMREIAEKVQARKRRGSELLVWNYLESTIAPLIEEAANDGKMKIEIHLNMFISPNLFEEKLRIFGYEMFKNADGIIEILW